MDDSQPKDISDVGELLTDAIKGLTGEVLTVDSMYFTLGDRMSAFSLMNTGIANKEYNSCLASVYTKRFLAETRYLQ